MNRYILLAPMLVFGIGGFSLYLYFIQPGPGGPFRDNLVPELIGFCVEGFFLVGILSYFQRIKETQHKQDLWLSLHGSLRDMLSKLDVALLADDSEPASSTALETSKPLVRQLLTSLDVQTLHIDQMVSLKRSALKSLELSHDLIPVAAQLSAAHMRWWIAIVEDMNHLSQAKERPDIENNIQSLLHNLMEFDRLKL